MPEYQKGVSGKQKRVLLDPGPNIMGLETPWVKTIRYGRLNNVRARASVFS